MGKRYRLISGYWAFDLLFRRLQRNWGVDFLLLLLFVVTADVVDVVDTVDWGGPVLIELLDGAAEEPEDPWSP